MSICWTLTVRLAAGTGVVQVHSPTCTGNEDRFTRCSFTGYDVTLAACADHSNDVSVRCNGQCQARSLLLKLVVLIEVESYVDLIVGDYLQSLLNASTQRIEWQ